VNKILFVCMLGYFLTLCISSMTASEKNKPQEETCFDAVIVPEQYDKTIVEQVARCIGKRAAVICLTTVLAQLMKIAEPTISNLKNNNEWTIFTDNSERIFVLLPFGHTESSDAQKLLAKFGLINLKYVAPGNIISMIRSEKIESAWFVEQFDQLFIKNQQEHVVPRKHFFVMGHGQTNDLIAGLSIRPTKLTEFGRFLRTIESINTELIYVVSCYASGPNIITLQNELIGQAKKLFQHSSISCMVIVQATTDEITAGQFIDNIRTFFLNVNRYFIEQSRKDVPIKNRITLANVISPLYAVSPLVINLPSVRLPGSNSFFRPIMVDKIKTITFLDIKRLLTQAIFQKRFARPGFSVGEKDILIGADIKYVLVYPAVVPTNILVSSLLVPKFISKIPGKACHIIDSLTFEGTVSREFENQQIGNLFWYPFGSDKLEIEGAEEGSKITVETYTYGESEKAWFIKTVIYYKDGKEFKLQDVIIVKYGHMPTSRPERRGELMFKKNGQYYQCFEGQNYEQAIDEQQYWTQVANILKNSMPDKNALYEATGGGQDLSSINEAIAQLLSQMERAKSIKINGLLAEMSNKVADIADQ